MAPAQKPQFQDSYTDVDFDTLGFHDCHVFGVGWDMETYAFVVDLDYIIEWIAPEGEQGAYRFWVAKAKLQFNNVADLQLRLDWRGIAPGCQIAELNRGESRATPNGRTQRHWEFELSEPEGELSLWATDFELSIVGEAILTDSQSLRC